MRVLITGATGLIGKEIMELCDQANIQVNYLTTNKDKLVIDSRFSGYYWNPNKAQIDLNCFIGVTVIINLVGASVVKRWTVKYKKEIISSRKETVLFIQDILRTNKHTIRQVVSASAIGIYPSSFRRYYTEDAEEKDNGFLGEVVKQWEEAVLGFESIGIEVSMLRIGLVLSGKGGAFPKMAKPILYGMGTVFGNGKQWQSWIHIHDLANLFLFVIKNKNIGIFNAVAPNPVSHEKLINTIADLVNRIIILPKIPQCMLSLILGEMHIILCSSQRVSSSRIEKLGFGFRYGNITQAVAAIMKQKEDTVSS